ncbi:uncharacterized protein BJX67DRAFT_379018 [Aspergillus lucknowensis]|uniref:N-acetyltransferase domain-containing protein n=1 Tax=Aspergillus lucknowensis TaxID=176173 RepID=A0ABR4LY67_9EURO
MQLRQATPDDLEAMTEVMVSAFPMDPQWDYRFPLRQEYPKDHWQCTRVMLSGFLRRDHFVVNVIVAPESEDGGGSRNAVSLAVWELQYEEAGELCLPGCDERRDANPAHMKAFDGALSAAKQQYFDSVYGDRQVHLWILGTHPQYQRHGFGTKQCVWGMEFAKAHAAPVTVFSSPMGGALYASLGFRTLGQVVVQVEGEEEKLTIGAMIYEDGRRSSHKYVGGVLGWKHCRLLLSLLRGVGSHP